MLLCSVGGIVLTPTPPVPDQRAFGKTGLQVSEIGFGCSSLGTVFGHDADQDGLQALDYAVERGINFFDTADAYSLGNSERLLGRAFRGRRHKLIIATKGGSRFTPLWRSAAQSTPLLAPLRQTLRPFKRFFNLLRHSQKQYDFSDSYLRQAAETSLQNLQTDYIDIYQLYNPTREVLEAGDFSTTLEALKAEGKIRYWGISCRTAQDALLCLRFPGISSIQIPVSLIDQEPIDTVIPRIAERGVAVIAREPLGQGLLTRTPTRTMAEQSSRSREEIDRRKRHSQSFHSLAGGQRTMAQAALRFVLQISGISTVIPGVANRAQLEENLGALSAPRLNREEFVQARSMSSRAGAS
ncbi:MAG: aldo/keto reductase [Gemmatimonadales bacterium]